MEGRVAVPLGEPLAHHLTPQGTAGRWEDAGLVELAKILLQGQAWRFPETSEDCSQLSLCDRFDDMPHLPGSHPGAR
jgi:hypothetical protein